MTTQSQMRRGVNALRAAEHAIEAARGALLMLSDTIDDAGYACDVGMCATHLGALRASLNNLHDDLTLEATSRGDAIPDQGVIKPFSGGTGKGGGGT